MSFQATPRYTIAFHGNCIDGWMSTYIAYSALQHTSSNITMFPISPNQQATWPRSEQVTGTHVLLLDVSVPHQVRNKWIQAGALSVQIIDHHASAIHHWPAKNNPIDISRCAAYQTWQRFYPTLAIPSWLEHIDRIDRWDNPTYEDRCIREVLQIIAHKPVLQRFEEAFHLTQMFLTQIENQEGFTNIVQEGKVILEKKDAGLIQLLSNGAIHQFTEEYIKGWNLPAHWLHATVFIIDTTNVSLDTTEAAHLVFENYPAVQVFINYRKKLVVTPEGHKDSYTYSARSRGFDLTAGNIPLKGHKTAAGAHIVQNDNVILPFIIRA
jgi:oligoribonuclease NrnB/cAMP/cGMP phosphodiesterase (DHH superfamily)